MHSRTVSKGYAPCQAQGTRVESGRQQVAETASQLAPIAEVLGSEGQKKEE